MTQTKDKLHFKRILSALLRMSLRSRIYVIPLTMAIVFITLILVPNGEIPENVLGTLTEGVFVLFKGDPPYNPSLGIEFKIPILWLFINAYIAFLLRTYPIEVSRLYEQILLLKASRKTTWWLARYVCLILFIALVYIVMYISAFMFSWICGAELTFGSNAIQILLFPLLTSIAFSCLQAFLNLITKPILSFSIIIGIQIVSAYYFNPIAIGNYSILIRSDFALTGGISLATVIPVTTIIILACLMAGSIAIKITDQL